MRAALNVLKWLVIVLKALRVVAVGLVVLMACALASTLLDPVMARFLTWLLQVIQHA